MLQHCRDLLRIGIACVCGSSAVLADAPQNWPQFRGPQATGAVGGATNLPDTWSATENIAWRQDISGRGWSSPIVWGDRVFLTTVINQGDSEQPKKGLYFGGNRPDPPPAEHLWLVLCLALDSGEVLWRHEAHRGQPQTSIHLKNSYASETPVTDGQHLYVLFGGVGVFCLDFDGNRVWAYPLQPRPTRYGWGTAASPVLHGDRLYVVNDNEEESYLLCLDKGTGEEVWRVPRDEKSNWATPYVWQHDLRTEIVTPGTGLVRSYDLSGNLLWSLSGMSSITIATPYEQDGLLYLSSGYVMDDSRPLYAIRPGAGGDITLSGDESSNDWIAWSRPQGAPYNPTTLVYRGIVYVLHDRGLLAAYDAADGSEIYRRQRIPDGRAFTASPWAYDGKVFCLNEDGVTFVIRAGTQFEILRTNTLAEDDMGMATPALSGDRLLIRTAARVYCIRKP
jgi:outer membrane protein assembly factor BamB